MIVEIIEILDAEMAEPGLYGWFHNLWLLITAAATILLCRFCKAGTSKQVCAVVLSVALAVIFWKFTNRSITPLQWTTKGRYKVITSGMRSRSSSAPRRCM